MEIPTFDEAIAVAEALMTAKVMRKLGGTLTEIMPLYGEDDKINIAKGYMYTYEEGDICDFDKNQNYTTKVKYICDH